MSRSDVTEEDRPVSTASFLGASADEESAPSKEHDSVLEEAETQEEAPESTDLLEDDNDEEGENKQDPEPEVVLEQMDPVDVKFAEMLKSAHVAPPGAPIPTGWWARQRYDLWTKGHGKPFVVPPLGKTEAKEHWRKKAEVELYREDLVGAMPYYNPRAMFPNGKGGASKTPSSTNMISVLYSALESVLYLIELNENSGTTCRQMGLRPRDVAKLRYAIKHLDEFDSPAKIMGPHGLGRQNRRGNAVWVMASGIGKVDDFTFEEVVRLLLQLSEMGAGMAFDPGNNDQREANKAGAAVATNLIVPCMFDDPDTFDLGIETLWTIAQMGMHEKVRRSRIMVNATPEGVTQAKIKDKLNSSVLLLSENLTDAQFESVPDNYLSTGPDGKRVIDLSYFNLADGLDRIHLVPFDQYVADKQPAHADSLQIDTLIAYLKIWVAIYHEKAPVPSLETILATEELLEA